MRRLIPTLIILTISIICASLLIAQQGNPPGAYGNWGNGVIGGSIQNTQVAVGTAANTIGTDGNLIWDATVADPPRKQLTVQGSQGVLRPYNYTNALNSTWSIDFSGHQADAATASFGDIQATVIANTNGAVSGQLDIHTRNAGALVTAISIAKDGTTTVPAIKTSTDCAVNSVSPAACAAACSGAFVVPTTTTTYTVNTTCPTTNASHILLFPRTDASGLPSAPTCVAVAVTSSVARSAHVNNTSFTFILPSTTGTTCWDYLIVSN